jgi:cobalt/nickel transport system permease protein
MGGAGAGLGLAAHALRRSELPSSRLALAAGLGGLVFAAQAINVPVLSHSSAHLVGGVLLAWTVGPSLGVWTMALVLALQAFLLGDGGTMALGANVLNMALLPAALVALAQRAGATEWTGATRYASAGLLAAVSVPLAASLIAVEAIAFRAPGEMATWGDFSLRLLAVHLWIGVGEGLLTAGLVAAVERLTQLIAAERAWKWAAAMLGTGLALVAIALPLATELPDGYESAAERSGLATLLSESEGLLPDTLLAMLAATVLAAVATYAVGTLLTRVAPTQAPVRR